MNSDVFAAASLFASLSDPTRLRILNLVSEGEVCVCHLVEVLGVVQPKVSRHLAFLRRRGVVAARRQGRWMHYRWARPPHPAAVGVMASLREWMARDEAMRLERGRLKTLCCP